MRHRLAAACLAALLAALPAAGRGAEPGGEITVAGVAAGPAMLASAVLARLPTRRVAVSFLTSQGNRASTFAGPLLWDVLAEAKAIDPAQHRGEVAQIVVVTGADGYRAVLALAELAPEFEAKPVILAQEMDGSPLGPGHLRVVVPADKRGGRSVRDVTRIEVKDVP